MMSALFDAYLIVDWSANSTPKTGKDSIWWCHLMRDKSGTETMEVQNPATRLEAFSQLRSILHAYLKPARCVLVGFDFAYAYPAGFAASLVGEASPPWRAVWRYLSEQVVDSPRNANNRFAVAASMNQLLSGAAVPFWGCPQNRQGASLSMYKPGPDAVRRFPAFRLAEQGNTTKSVWQLFYNGSVGSQALMGIPYIYKLRGDPELEGISRVWPFETGLQALTAKDLQAHRIIHAEIYPSLLNSFVVQTGVKDRQQVIALARHFAELDSRGRLGQLFAGGRQVSEAERHLIESEEGWILGV